MDFLPWEETCTVRAFTARISVRDRRRSPNESRLQKRKMILDRNQATRLLPARLTPSTLTFRGPDGKPAKPCLCPQFTRRLQPAVRDSDKGTRPRPGPFPARRV